MEQTSQPKQVSIVNLSEQQQTTRLTELFDCKILDKFVEECQTLKFKGVKLEELSKKYNLKINLQYQYQSMKRVLDMTKDILQKAHSVDQGWKDIQIDQKCTLSVRSHQTFIEMKSKGTLPNNIKCFLYLAYLIKLYTQCLPFCKESIDVKQPTKLEKIGYIRLSIPIPFIKDRCTYLRGVGFDRLQKNGTVCIFAEGINDNKQYLQQNDINIDQKMKGKQLLDLKYFAVQLRHVNESTTEYSGYALVDHHISLLPEKLILFVTKQIAKYLFHHLLSKLSNFQQSVWAKEMKQNYGENAQFYDWIALQSKRFSSNL